MELRLIKLHPNVWLKSLHFLDQLVKINYISEKWSIEASGGDGMQYNFVSECNSSLICTCGIQICKLNQFRCSRTASIAGHKTSKVPREYKDIYIRLIKPISLFKKTSVLNVSITPGNWGLKAVKLLNMRSENR
jgi:hypothetical protein